MAKDHDLIRWFETLGSGDVPIVGGKNASLGEMISTLKAEGIAVPDGFATTANAYWTFINQNDIADEMQRYLEILHSGEHSLSWWGGRCAVCF